MNLGFIISSLIWCSFDYVLNRFFIIHFTLALVIGAFIVIHVLILHSFTSFTPFSSSSIITSFIPILYKDFFVLFLLFSFIFILLFFEPDMLGNCVNQSFANPLVTPVHIMPEWYFLILYAILRSFPNKIVGILMTILMFLLL